MSIYSTRLLLVEDNDCRGPIVYEGSNVLPSEDDRRGGSVDLASIADAAVRGGDRLRLSVRSQSSRKAYDGRPYVPGGDATVLLDRSLVELLRDEMTAWLERAQVLGLDT